jgi:hypothetical protein
MARLFADITVAKLRCTKRVSRSSPIRDIEDSVWSPRWSAQNHIVHNVFSFSPPRALLKLPAGGFFQSRVKDHVKVDCALCRDIGDKFRLDFRTRLNSPRSGNECFKVRVIGANGAWEKNTSTSTFAYKLEFRIHPRQAVSQTYCFIPVTVEGCTSHYQQIAKCIPIPYILTPTPGSPAAELFPRRLV